MANLLNNLFQQPQAPQINPQFQQMAQMLKAAQNPAAALNAMAQNNPQLQQVMQMCAGKNPRDVFMQACQQRGIDPQQAMQQLGLK